MVLGGVRVQLVLAARGIDLEPHGQIVGGRQHGVGAALLQQLGADPEHRRRLVPGQRHLLALELVGGHGGFDELRLVEHGGLL